MVYHKHRLNLQLHHIHGLASGKRIKIGNNMFAGGQDIHLTKKELNKMAKASVAGKGMFIGPWGADQIQHNLTHGTGLWSNIKDFFKKGYEYVKPALGRVGEQAKVLASNLAGRALDKGEEMLAAKANDLYNKGYESISNYGKAPPAPKTVEQIAPKAREMPRGGIALPGLADFAPPVPPMPKKQRFPVPPKNVAIPEFDHKEMRSNLLKAIRDAPDDLIEQHGGSIAQHMAGLGFFGDLWGGIKDLGSSAYNGVLKPLVEKVVSKAPEMLMAAVQKRLGGSVNGRGIRGRGIHNAGAGIIPHGIR